MTAVDKPALGALRSEDERARAQQRNEEAKRQRAEASALQLVEDPDWAHDEGPPITDDFDSFGERIAAGGLDLLGHGADADGIQVGPTPAVDRLRSGLLYGDAIRSIPPRTPLVEGWLDLDSLAVLYGRPGSGKSFVALDIALHVATGSWWHGNAVTAGPVLYVAAEGAPGLGQRLTAWLHHNKHYTAPANVVWLPQAVNVLDVVSAQALAVIAGEVQPVFVVIDTLARSMPGGDENSSRDMGLVIAAADRIRTTTGACVALVHHSGKDTTAGARGHSSLLGAVDTELELKNSDGRLMLTTTKQKDHADNDEPLRLVLAPAADSVAVARYTGQRPGTDSGDLSRSRRVVLDALASIDIEGGVPNSAWKEVAVVQNGVSKSTFMQALKDLIDAGMVHKTGTEHRPLYNVTTRENT